MKITTFCPMILAAVAVAAQPASAQFTPLGAGETYVTGMSGDGTIVVGVRGQYGPAFRWTAETGVVNLGSVSQQAAISRDGRTIVGNALDANGISHAAIWQSGTRWIVLPPPANSKVLDNTVSSAWSVSGDGFVISGLVWVQPTGSNAFRYDVRTGMVALGSIQGKSSRGSVVSADGNVVAGWDENPYQDSPANPWRGAIWWQGVERLLHPYGWIGQVGGINDSGSVMVGRGHPMSLSHAYRFTSWDGAIVDLGSIPRGFRPNTGDKEDQSIAAAVSDDGDVVVGQSGWQPPTDAFIWTSETGMLKLGEHLTRKGITGHESWTLTTATCVSPDGKVIAGIGLNNEAQRVEGFIVRLP